VSQPHDKSRQRPILCYVTDRKSLGATSNAAQCAALLEQIAAAAAAGVDWIQIREKDLSGREIAMLTREARAQVKKQNRLNAGTTRILVNDRLDIAISEQTAGVHLRENSLPVRDVRRWLGTNIRPASVANKAFLLGASCHSLEAAVRAERDGANYIFYGAVFATPSKAAYGAPQGLTALAEVCSAVAIPVLAIGGITQENTPACRAAGAAGIAGIRLFQDAADVPSLTAALHH
jgi:thiamine-phosphate pyrophosphorylase